MSECSSEKPRMPRDGLVSKQMLLTPDFAQIKKGVDSTIRRAQSKIRDAFLAYIPHQMVLVMSMKCNDTYSIQRHAAPA
jgi:hypothetical protein